MTHRDDKLIPAETDHGFRELAATQLAGLLEPMLESKFWNLVDDLGWGRSADVAAAGMALAKEAELDDCVTAVTRAQELAFTLRERIEEWERETDRQLPLSDDQFVGLVHHVIGLGEPEYVKVLRDPELALKRAELGTFRESFLNVFQQALEAYPVSEYVDLLRGVTDPVPFPSEDAPQEAQVIEHQEHGLGIARLLAWKNQVRISFPGGDLVVDQ